ncbi:glycogen debranching protein GlgX [Nakamurella flava]|uniref:Glycogen debranching protein GlgX n=1 Tax=Nakamurella flava TaxID=2576308 RepID=A0A4U6QPU5_9ACTN|nr:glycogen debranching protein GlgX [Nakamurella flava]
MPFPLGATAYRDGVNFSVVADGRPGVTDVLLCLIDEQGREHQVTMAERTHGSWHTFVPGVVPGQRYGYRVPANDPAKLLLDPYARQVTTTEYDLPAAAAPGAPTAGRAPVGIVVDPPVSRSARPWVPWEQTVVYEAHVAGLTRLHPAVPQELRGTYLGVAHPAVIEHLQRLHVTTLELLPVHATAAEPGLLATGRRNYWGYSTLSFFAPHPGYATAPGRETTEFVAMVDALHRAGIEVVLDVVYNHTCEGGPDLPIALSWRGLSPSSYYLRPGRDITGTGNSLDAGQLPMVRMVVDSLRYWAGSLGVDGFRFDLASVLGRPHGGHFDPGAALLTAIATDPLLSTRKLIAEPWDATGEGYAVGRFGVQWSEWNDRFRDCVRDFWRGVGGVRDLGYRLSGSSDLFAPDRRPWTSINFVTAHDGFTLRDLVSYDRKHNAANGEDNRDGTDNNRSHNYGVEGATDDPEVRALRTRQARNLAATLILATGTPMITMGDELWRTQLGNNNAYCQDNELSWVRWPTPAGRPDHEPDDAEALDLLAFFQRALDIRHRSPGLRQAEFFEGRSVSGDGHPDLVWFAPDGRTMSDGDWFDGGRHTILLWINGTDVRGHTPAGQPLSDDSWLLVLHAAAEPTTVTLPDSPWASGYELVLDTDTPTGAPGGPAPEPGRPVVIPGRTTWLLRARPGHDDDPGTW